MTTDFAHYEVVDRAPMGEPTFTISVTTEDIKRAVTHGRWELGITPGTMERLVWWLRFFAQDDPDLPRILAWGGGDSYWDGSGAYLARAHADSVFGEALAKAIDDDERGDPTLGDVVEAHLSIHHGRSWRDWGSDLRTSVVAEVRAALTVAFESYDRRRCGAVTTRGTRCRNNAKASGVCSFHR